MTDPFSVAAGSFAVLGVAEQICRSIKELYTFLGAIKSAPREIQQLKTQLQDLGVIVIDVKEYWAESQAQSGPGLRNVVPTFVSSLNGFKTELEVLRSLLKVNGAAKSDIKERIIWVLQKEQIAAESIRRLESHKTTLIAALAIAGRRKEIVLHHNIAELKAQLGGLLLKPDTTSKRVFQVPSTSTDFFTGREKELTFINQIFANPSDIQRRAVIWGCAGAGKTQLALAYAHKRRQEYDTVIWVSASSSDALQRSFAGLSRPLELPEGDEPDLDQSPSSQQRAVTAVMTWLQRNDKWLLVIDNADNLKEVNIKSYFPATSQGHLIITSRNRQAVGFGAGVELGEMDAEEAKKLLLARAGIDSPEDHDHTEAASIVKSLGYLALAIDHAGAYVLSVCGTLEDYHELFKTNRAEILKDKPDVSTYEESVFRTFEISFKKLQERKSMLSAFLLTTLGFLDPECADESLIVDIVGEKFESMKPLLRDKAKFNAALQELLSFSLIHRKTEGRVRLLTLHPLVHHWCRDRLNAEHQRELRVLICGAFLVAWVDQTKVLTMLIPHVMYVIRLWMATPKEEDENGKATNFCRIAGALLCGCYLGWYYQGFMQELFNIATRIDNGLKSTAAKHGLALLAGIADVQAVAADYVRSAESAETTRLAFVERWLSEPALQILADVRDGNTSYELPATLAETFKYSIPSDFNVLLLCLEDCSRQAAREKKWAEALLFAKLSELPYEKGGTPVRSDVQALVLAEKSAESGDPEVLASTLRNIIQSSGRPYSGIVLTAAMQFSRLMDKQKRPAALEEIVGPLVIRKGVSQAVIWAELESCYIWLRKGLANARSQQGRVEEARDILLETYDTVRPSQGKESLGQWHAAYLLARFFAQGDEAEKYRQDGETVFKNLYGAKEKLASAEALNMGMILLEQGSLDEAEYVFECFYTLSSSILGDQHELTRKAFRLKQRAHSELEVEKRREEEGNFAFEFGSFLNPRKLGTDL